jgi:Tfp pilus assembly PilM family ATPase
MLPFLDVILGEVKRAQFNYASQQGGRGRKIERVILSGGGANLLGIEKYVSRELGMPAVKAVPFGRFGYPTALEPIVRDLNPLMSVALGLALRGVA